MQTIRTFRITIRFAILDRAGNADEKRGKQLIWRIEHNYNDTLCGKIYFLTYGNK